jgi:photosystem II stability/assembly factor-like uncharacterized protein
MKSLVSLVVGVLLFIVGQAVAHADWRVINYPGAVATYPKDVSGNTVVGHYYNEDDGAQGFVYDGETWTDLDCPGALYTFPNGISGNKIVGSYFEDEEVYHGFVYDGMTWTTLDYPGADETHVYGIDGDMIIGNYLDGESDYGFIYDVSNETWEPLDYPNSHGTFVNGISGNTVANTTWTTLDFPGADSTNPQGMDGQSIVGEFNSGGDWHGFIYSIAPDPSSHSARAEGWVVGKIPKNNYGVILHTINGGHEWVRQGLVDEVPNVGLYSVKAVDRHTAWVVGANDSGYGVILRTDDGGQTWARQGDSSTIPDVELTGVDAANRKTAWVIGEKGTILRTDDGGKTWTQQTSGTDSTLLEVAVVNSRIAWISGNADIKGYPVVLRTTNGGRTWERKVIDGMPSLVTAVNLTAINAQTAWVAGQNLFAAKTTDGGETWEIQMESGNIDNNDVCGVTPNTAWIATDYNNVYRTTDGGTTWDKLLSPGQVPGTYYLLGVSAWGKDTAWVTGHGMGSHRPDGVILHTTDGGATWRVQSTPVNVDFGRGGSFVGSRK